MKKGKRDKQIWIASDAHEFLLVRKAELDRPVQWVANDIIRRARKQWERKQAKKEKP